MADMHSNLKLYYNYNAGDATDTSGNVKNGTLVGSPSFVTGRIGSQAISLNGSSQYITMSSTGAFADNSVTIATWVKFNSLPAGENNMICERDDDGSTWGIALETNGTAFRPQIVIGSSGYNFSSATTITTGTWYHVAVTYDGTNLRLYLKLELFEEVVINSRLAVLDLQAVGISMDT
jgi:hypothetical protein